MNKNKKLVSKEIWMWEKLIEGNLMGGCEDV